MHKAMRLVLQWIAAFFNSPMDTSIIEGVILNCTTISLTLPYISVAKCQLVLNTMKSIKNGLNSSSEFNPYNLLHRHWRVCSTHLFK